MAAAESGVPSRAEIEAGQLEQLQKLLAAILPANAFYSEKLKTAGVDSNIRSLEEFRAHTPFTFKRELIDDQVRHAPYGTNLTYPLASYTRFCQTSATTGKPMRWLDTPESWAWMMNQWDRVFKAAGAKPGDRIFFAFSFGPFLGFWLAFDAAARMGCLCIPGGGLRSAARLSMIIDTGATALCCTPTYAIRLAEVAAEEGIDLTAAKVRTLILAGEAGASIPATRMRIEKLWNGASVMDHHGMSETGPVSYGCPSRKDLLHVIESAYLSEVIDPATGNEIPPGGVGELVLTTLGRLGSPLLRYRTGDIVRRAAAGPCACGSHELALEGGILGRTDDMVVVRGVNVYPTAVEEILRSCGGVMEYRVEIREIRALAELSIQVEPEPEHENDPTLVHRIEAALREAFALRVSLSIVPCGSLPRFEMKAKRWVRVL